MRVRVRLQCSCLWLFNDEHLFPLYRILPFWIYVYLLYLYCAHVKRRRIGCREGECVVVHDADDELLSSFTCFICTLYSAQTWNAVSRLTHFLCDSQTVLHQWHSNFTAHTVVGVRVLFRVLFFLFIYFIYHILYTLTQSRKNRMMTRSLAILTRNWTFFEEQRFLWSKVVGFFILFHSFLLINWSVSVNISHRFFWHHLNWECEKCKTFCGRSRECKTIKINLFFSLEMLWVFSFSIQCFTFSSVHLTWADGHLQHTHKSNILQTNYLKILLPKKTCISMIALRCLTHAFILSCSCHQKWHTNFVCVR